MSVGIVVVSHSARLAEGAVELARAMATTAVEVAVAAGIDDPRHPLGCDPLRVREAIEEVDGGDGVLVLMDLGSAVLSAEFALGLLEPEDRDRVLLCDAPFVEGLVAAAVAAMSGAGLGEVAGHARAALQAKREHLAGPGREPVAAVDAPPVGDGPALPDAVATFTVDTPHGLHARPAAAIVRSAGRWRATAVLRNLSTGTGPVPATSLNGILTLEVRQGHLIQVDAGGPDAAALAADLRALAHRDFDQRGPAPLPAAPAVSAQVGAGGTRLAGLTGAPGLGVGPASHLTRPVPGGGGQAAAPPEQDKQRLRAAVAAVADAVRRTVADHPDAQVAAILQAQLLALADPLVVETAERLVDAGHPAAEAWRLACDELIGRIGGLDDAYLAARAADLSALRDEVVARLDGAGERAELTGVVLGHDLSPMQAASLDPVKVVAVVTAAGSPSAHSTMILRASGIPAVVAVGPAVLAVPGGTTLVVDADAATVETRPSPGALAEAAGRIARREAGRRAAGPGAALPAYTRDGVRVRVVANIALPADARSAAAAGADGVGLLRSELLFAGHAALPTEDEQVALYGRICAELSGRHVVLRTLDVGGDKPLAYLDTAPEANPFLGLRGIRLTLRRPELMVPQLRAALRTVAAGHPLRLMLPMVSVAEEIHRTRELLGRARADLAAEGVDGSGRLPLGIMVETPAAALKAATLLAEVDFVSIGTNDLTQYTLAAERGNADVAYLLREWDPAVLRLISTVATAADEAGVPVAVCGAAAEDPRMVPLLLGLGVRELSVSAPNIAAVKDQVRRLDAGRLARDVVPVLRAGSAEEVLDLVHRMDPGTAPGKGGPNA